MNEINKVIQRIFKTHKATLIQNDDRFCIIDWRKADGSSNHYVNYIVDKKRGSLIVSGDLGDSIATWYNPITISNLKNYIHNDVGYYISKFQASSNGYFYESKNIIEDIKKEIGDFEDDSILIDDEFVTINEFWKLVEDEVVGCIYNNDFIPSNKLINILEESGCTDIFEWLYTCGRRIETRVYLWAEGFYLACEQLNL